MTQFFSDAEKAALNIQAIYRGRQARQKYQIKPLQTSELNSYATFIVGNDPVMKALGSYSNTDNSKIAFIGTSGVRSISLACKIAGCKDIVPKIIMIDNSLEVIQFWRNMRHFIRGKTEQKFLEQFPHFLSRNHALYRDIDAYALKKHNTKDVTYLNQNPHNFFKALIKKYGFDYIAKTICHAAVIPQSWTNSDVFIKIKNILSYQKINKIYMYPSNIATCIKDEKLRAKMLKNIETFAPTLAIHTDCCELHEIPENVYLLENNNSQHASATLFQPSKHADEHLPLSFEDFINIMHFTDNTTMNTCHN